jgi:hypothetical protein
VTWLQTPGSIICTHARSVISTSTWLQYGVPSVTSVTQNEFLFVLQSRLSHTCRCDQHHGVSFRPFCDMFHSHYVTYIQLCQLTVNFGTQKHVPPIKPNHTTNFVTNASYDIVSCYLHQKCHFQPRNKNAWLIHKLRDGNVAYSTCLITGRLAVSRVQDCTVNVTRVGTQGTLFLITLNGKLSLNGDA